MKKVMFVHATVRVRNRLHKPPLILEKVPVGMLSRAREYNANEEETVLAGVLKDCALLTNIDELVVITSLDTKDDAIIESVSDLHLEKPVKWYRVSDDEAFSFIDGHTGALPGEWPFMRFPVYGAWHMAGFEKITALHGAECAVIVQADDCYYLDVPAFDTYIEKYSQKGVWGEAFGSMYPEHAVINVSFMYDLLKKYRKKCENRAVLKNDYASYRIDGPIRLYNSDTGRKDFIIPAVHADHHMYSLYDPTMLMSIKQLYCGAFNDVSQSIQCDGLVQGMDMPQYVEIEVHDNSTTMAEIIKTLPQMMPAVTVHVSTDREPVIEECLSLVKQTNAFCMMELERHIFNTLSNKTLETYAARVDLMHIHADADIQTDKLISFLEGIRAQNISRPLVVVEITPSDVERFSSIEPLVNKLVVKSNGSVKNAVDMIDFAPFERIPCKKVGTSLVLRNTGFGPCRFINNSWPEKKQQIDEIFAGPELTRLREEHQKKNFSCTDACTTCREWYIADIPFMSTAGSLLPASECLQIPAELIDSKEQCYKLYDEIGLLRDAVQQCIMSGYSILTPALRLQQSNQWRLLSALLKFFIPIGDRLCQFGDVEKALDAWEQVLKYDPSNEYIHGRLDELLEEAGQGA